MTTYLPPNNLENYLTRTIAIPDNATILQTKIQYTTIDVRPLLIVNENSINTILTSIAAWYATITNAANKTRMYIKLIEQNKITELLKTTDHSKRSIKEEHINTDPTYLAWKDQLEWLELISETLIKITTPLCQTYSANLRKEQAMPTK